MRIKIISAMLAICFLSDLSAVCASDTADGNKAGLESGKAETIRTISWNVLAAKHSESSNSELLKLRQNIDELRQEIAKLQGLISEIYAVGTLTINDGKNLEKDEQEQEKVRQRGETRKNKEKDLRITLGQLRQQRVRFEVGTDSAPESRRNHELRVAGKVKELEDELENILNGPSEEHFKKLEVLREKLEIKHSKPSTQLDQTPTISSIVRHRE